MENGFGGSNRLAHKGFYAALGCGLAAAKDGDCASGATGAVVGEMVGESIGKDMIADGIFDDDEKKLLTTLSQLGAIGSAAVTGQDADSANTAAQNAVTNNTLKYLNKEARNATEVIMKNLNCPAVMSASCAMMYLLDKDKDITVNVDFKEGNTGIRFDPITQTVFLSDVEMCNQRTNLCGSSDVLNFHEFSHAFDYFFAPNRKITIYPMDPAKNPYNAPDSDEVTAVKREIIYQQFLGKEPFRYSYYGDFYF